MLAGEAIGFGFAGLVGWGATVVWGDRLIAIVLIVLAGTLEGAIVGLAQALAVERVSHGRWTALTAGAALVAWTVGMLMGGRVPVELLPLLAPALLLGMGTLMGVAQWIELRRHAEGAGRWILANALAWPLGLLWVYGASALVSSSTPLALGVSLIVGSGVAMGVTVGVITGVTMERIVAGGQSSSSGLSARSGQPGLP